MSTRKKIIEAISIEKYRHVLAKYNIDTELLLTYSNKNPSIPNSNNTRQWDELNFIAKSDKKNNPIAWDRLGIISKYVLMLNNKKDSILNIGFGPCTLENYLGNSRLKKYKWFGIDFSGRSVDYARSRFYGSFMKMNVLNMRFKNKMFKSMVMSEVLEHVSPRDTLHVLRKIYSLLTDNGYLILSIPVNEGLELMLINNNNPNSHTRIYTEQIITKELEVSGFKVIKIIRLRAYRTRYSIKKIFNRIFNHSTNYNNLIIICKK